MHLFVIVEKVFLVVLGIFQENSCREVLVSQDPTEPNLHGTTFKCRTLIRDHYSTV